MRPCLCGLGFVNFQLDLSPVKVYTNELFVIKMTKHMTPDKSDHVEQHMRSLFNISLNHVMATSPNYQHARTHARTRALKWLCRYFNFVTSRTNVLTGKVVYVHPGLSPDITLIILYPSKCMNWVHFRFYRRSLYYIFIQICVVDITYIDFVARGFVGQSPIDGHLVQVGSWCMIWEHRHLPVSSALSKSLGRSVVHTHRRATWGISPEFHVY